MKYQISLDGLTAGLLIPDPLSPVTYLNQVGGKSCQERSLVSVLFPLMNAEILQASFEEHFVGPKWKGWCETEIDADTADFMDAVLSEFAPYLQVNRNKLGASVEAWVHVRVKRHDVLMPLPSERTDAVLTWFNSD